MSRRGCESCGATSPDKCSCFVCDNCYEVCTDPWTADPEVAPDDERRFCLACLDVLYPPTSPEEIR